MMKHLMALPDLTKVPPAFQTVLAKALAKDPKDRQASAAELVTEVERLFADVGLAPVPQTMKLPTVSAADDARPSRLVAATAENPLSIAQPAGRLHPVEVSDKDLPTVLPANGRWPFRLRLSELATSLLLSGILAGMASVLLAALNLSDDFVALGTIFFLTVGVCWSVLIPASLWTSRRGDDWGRRLVLMVFGTMVGLGAFWLDGWSTELHWPASPTTLGNWLNNPIAVAAGFVSYFGLGLGLPRWWRIAERYRRSWFSFGPVITTMIWAFVLLIVWPWRERPYGLGALILGSMIVQWVSPWTPPPPPPPKRLRLRRVPPMAEAVAAATR
jgi:hypothetical protein